MMSGWFALLVLMAPPVEVATRSQGVVSGTLVELSAERVVVQSANKSESLATGDVVDIRPVATPKPPEMPGTIVARFVDGSQLTAVDYRVEQGKATLVLFGDTKLTLRTREFDHVRLMTSPGAIGAQFGEIVRGERSGDTIVVVKGETLDFVSGTAGDVTDETVYFDVDGDKVPVKRPKVEGLLYFHAATDPLPSSVCAIELVSGGKVEAISAKSGEQTLDVTTPAGATLALPWSLVGNVRFKGSYLSDLEPESVAYSRGSTLGFVEKLRPNDLALHRPRLNEPFELGQPLRLGGVPHSRSIGLYGGSEVSFRLSNAYRQVQLTAGIDDSARPHGRVELKILSENGELASHVLTGRDAPLVLEVPLNGARRVKIVARSLSGGVHDRVILGEPRLVK